MFGVVVLHWTLVLTVALECFIVRVMKGPAYVADAYPLPGERDEPGARLCAMAAPGLPKLAM